MYSGTVLECAEGLYGYSRVYRGMEKKTQTTDYGLGRFALCGIRLPAGFRVCRKF